MSAVHFQSTRLDPGVEEQSRDGRARCPIEQDFGLDGRRGLLFGLRHPRTRAGSPPKTGTQSAIKTGPNGSPAIPTGVRCPK
jgi:hypothetical protein